MNKQQLAAKIWESANQMRSKIEANEYKDYSNGSFADVAQARTDLAGAVTGVPSWHQ